MNAPKLVLPALSLAAGLVVSVAAAQACPNGYKTVWIQGNPVCQLDASASNNLTTPGGPKRTRTAGPAMKSAR